MSTTRDTTFHVLFQAARSAEGDDQTALGELLERYRNYLILLAELSIGARLRRKADAEDVVQQVLLQAVKGFHTFSGASESGDSERVFMAWLRQILRSRISDLLRRYRPSGARDVHQEQDFAAKLDRSSHVIERALLASSTSPSQWASRGEVAVRIADALAGISDDYRAVLIGRFFDGLSPGENARRLGLTADAEQKRYIRALEAIRPFLEDFR